MLDRRSFIKAAGLLGVSALVLSRAPDAAAYPTSPTYGAGGNDSRYLLEPVNGKKIYPATEDTLESILAQLQSGSATDVTDRAARLLGHVAVDGSVGVTNANIDAMKADLDSLLTKAGVLGGRTWSITETVPVSHANLDAGLSTLAKDLTVAKDSSLASILAQLDSKTSALATQATLAAMKAQTDKMTFDGSNNLLTAGAAGADPVGLKYSGAVGQIDPRNVRLLTTSDQMAVQPIAASVWDVADRQARLAGRVSVAASDGGAAIDVRAIRALTTADQASVQPIAASVWDVSDRSTRLAGRHSISATDGGAAIDVRVIRALTSSDVVDISDRAARLLGQVSLGNSSGKTNVMVTGNKVTTAVTADQVILTYTVTAGKTFYLEYVDWTVRLTTYATTATNFGTVSLESPAGTKLITTLVAHAGVIFPPYLHDFGEPIPIAAGTVIRVVCTPAATTSFTWQANIGGYEK